MSSEEDERSSASSSSEGSSDEEDEEDDGFSRKRKGGGGGGRAKRPRNIFEEDVEEADEDEEEEEMERVPESAELSRHEKETAARYAERMRQREAFADKGVEEITREIEMRHKAKYQSQQFAEVDNEEVELSRNKNLPTVTDPKLFGVRCSVGEEQMLMVQLMNKYQALKRRGEHPRVFSCVSPGTKGFIYIESRSESEVQKMLNGLRNVYRRLTLVPLAQMTTVMNVSKSSHVVKRGDYVRVSVYPYKGDLGQVYHASAGGRISVKIVPRIDYKMYSLDPEQRKARRKQRIIPPKKFFNEEEANMSRLHTDKKQYPKTGESLHYCEDMYFKDGYLIKDFSSKYVKTANVNPSVAELQSFRLGRSLREEDEQDPEADQEDQELLNQLQNNFSSGGDAVSHLAKGDYAVVDEGELKYLKGQILSVSVDGVAKFAPMQEGIRDQILEFPSSHLRKFFQVGNHVKCTGGKYAGETGTVVKVIDSGERWRAIVYADSSSKEIQVFVDDLHISEEIAAGSDSLGGYTMLDVVVLGQGQVGIITKIGVDGFDVLEGNNKVKKVRVNEIRYKMNPRRVGTAMDKNKMTISVGKVVKVVGGEYAGTEGTVKHIHRSQLFIHSRQRVKNTGMFVDRARNCKLSGVQVQRGSGLKNTGGRGRFDDDFQRMATGGRGGGRGRGRGRGRGGQDPLLGSTVRITGGRYKGYLGIVTAATERIATVELHSKMRKTKVDRSAVTIVGNASGRTQAPRANSFDHGPKRIVGNVKAVNQFESLGTPMHAPATPMTIISGASGTAWDPQANLSASIATPSVAWDNSGFKEPPTPAATGFGDSSSSMGAGHVPKTPAIPVTPAIPQTPAAPGVGDDSGGSSGFQNGSKVRIKDSGKIGVFQGVDGDEAIVELEGGGIKILPVSNLEAA